MYTCIFEKHALCHSSNLNTGSAFSKGSKLTAVINCSLGIFVYYCCPEHCNDEFVSKT